jgi:hypothetical protein
VEAEVDTTPRIAPWQGVLTVEGIESGDGRMFGANGLSWDEPPLPLMWQKETSHGGSTDKSVRVGSITKIWREPDASGRADVFLIKGEGHLDLDNPDGAEVQRRMANKDMRGNSVDVDSIKGADVELVYPEAPEGSESMLSQVFGQPELTVYKKGRIRATTMVEIPAFTEARLELVDNSTVTASDDCEECKAEIVVEDADGQRMAALTAASAMFEIPDLPPREWFEEPTDVSMDSALTVTAEGRIYGFVAPAGVRHRSFTQRAQYVPLRNVDYDRFHGGQTLVADGGRVSTGNITMDCGHATTAIKLTGAQAAEHYDNTCSIIATARVGENERGVWVAGALMPGVDASTVRKIMACRLSGDWRTHLDRPGWREFVAALLVPVPGFPMARNAASVEISEGALVASSVPVRMLINDQALDVRARVHAVAQRIGRDPESRRAVVKARVRAGRVAALAAKVQSFHGTHDQSTHGNRDGGVSSFGDPLGQNLSVSAKRLQNGDKIKGVGVADSVEMYQEPGLAGSKMRVKTTDGKTHDLDLDKRYTVSRPGAPTPSPVDPSSPEFEAELSKLAALHNANELDLTDFTDLSEDEFFDLFDRWHYNRQPYLTAAEKSKLSKAAGAAKEIVIEPGMFLTDPGRTNRRVSTIAQRVAALTTQVESFHGSHDQDDHGNWVGRAKRKLGIGGSKSRVAPEFVSDADWDRAKEIAARLPDGSVIASVDNVIDMEEQTDTNYRVVKRSGSTPDDVILDIQGQMADHPRDKSWFTTKWRDVTSDQLRNDRFNWVKAGDADWDAR